MKKKIVIKMEKQWTAKNIVGGITPAQKLAKALSGVLPAGTKVEDEEFTSVSVWIDTSVIAEDRVRELAVEYFHTIFGKGNEEVLSISVEEVEGKTEEPALSVDLDKKGTPLDSDKKDDNGVSAALFSDKPEQTKEEEPKEAMDSVMGEIDGLIGAEDFKALAHEIKDVAPYILKNKKNDVFVNQGYIFSVNDGYGISTYGELLAKLILHTGLRPIEVKGGSYVEIKLGVMDDKDPFSPEYPKGAFANLLRFVLSEETGNCVVCIDISEWMSALEGEHFKKLLKTLSRSMKKFVYVFRIPYVEKDVLERVQLALNDMMFVRPVVFPTLAREDLQEAAAKDIAEYGFTMEEGAWAPFHDRISEEKRDGKFYGFNTIKKIVRELVYKKYLANAKKGEDNNALTADDVATCLSIAKVVDDGLSGFEQLSKLVGGEEIRKQVEEILLQIQFARSGKSGAMKSPCIHMRFVGNPGTGKTTVARIVGKILKEHDVLRIGGFYEYAGRDFCGRYIGETAPKTASICRDAYGSVLFIDEAYTLYRSGSDGKDYGREALDTLIAEMENHRDDFVVIMAGYTDDMDTLMKGNAGLVGRMPYVIEFPNFTREQLYNIFVSMLEGCKYNEDLLEKAKEYFFALSDELIKSKEFSNARFVRNLYERMWAKALRRCQLEKTEEVVLSAQDFEQASTEKGFKAMMEKKTARLGFYE